MLTVDAVVKRYERKVAVDGVSFAVAAGETFGLLGPNGAGKTSVIRMIIDMMRPDAGSIAIAGRTTPDDLFRLIGYLPEERGLYQRQRVNEVLRYYALLKGIDADMVSQRIEETLDAVGALEFRRKRVRELSKGMQQKVQLAMALVNRPALLILDEPFSGLDPVNRDLVLEIIRRESRRGCAILLSTHMLGHVETICDRILLLHQGKDVLHGRVRDLRESFFDNRLLVGSDVAIPVGGPIARCEPVVHRGEPMSRLTLAAGATPDMALPHLLSIGVKVRHFERLLPSLDEIFVKAVGHE